MSDESTNSVAVQQWWPVEIPVFLLPQVLDGRKVSNVRQPNMCLVCEGQFEQTYTIERSVQETIGSTTTTTRIEFPVGLCNKCAADAFARENSQWMWGALGGLAGALLGFGLVFIPGSFLGGEDSGGFICPALIVSGVLGPICFLSAKQLIFNYGKKSGFERKIRVALDRFGVHLAFGDRATAIAVWLLNRQLSDSGNAQVDSMMPGFADKLNQHLTGDERALERALEMLAR